MAKNNREDEFSKTAQISNLITFMLFGIALIVESILLEWEVWPLILVGLAIIGCWVLHIGNLLPLKARFWVYAILMMTTFFYYGTHVESVFDLAIVISPIILLFTLTGVKALVNFAQFSYYATMLYGIAVLVVHRTEFGVLLVSRLILHLSVVTMVGWLARKTIEKWRDVFSRSEEEIEELKEGSERLNDFLANVSHELRTPVNAIVGLSGICIDKEKDEEVRKEMIAVRSAGHRISEQISDILDYSEIDRGKIVKNSEDYMISSVIHDLISDIDEYKKPEVELVINVDPEIPAVMHTDVTKLKKILRALISNGFKYTREGGVYVHLFTEKHDYGVNLNIEVKDTGIGMAQEEIEKIFDRYYQVDSSRSRSGGGLGLGLSIVNGFVISLGGFMTIKSRVDEGTTVRISIPQKVINAESCMSVSEPEKLGIASFLDFDKFPNPMVREFYNATVYNIVKGLKVQMHRVDNAKSLNKLRENIQITHLFLGEAEWKANIDLIKSISKDTVVVVVAAKDFALPQGITAKILTKPIYCFPIASILNATREAASYDKGRMMTEKVTALVVDDEPMNLVVAKSIFKRYGMNVFTVSSGNESILACRERNYDLIFMDHMMAEMDGVEAMKRIRADVAGLNRNTPMVALTANAMSSAKQMFLSEGFDAFVSKPIEIEELERTLKKLLPKSAIHYVEEEDAMPDTASGIHSNPSKESVMEFLPASSDENASAARPGSDNGITEKKTFRGSLRSANIDVEAGISYCAGDFEFYKVLLKQFSSEAEEKTASMEKYMKKKDWKNYEIIIHAVKSSSKMIGGNELSEAAFLLEKAAKAEEEDYITGNHASAMELYRKICQTIDELLPEDNRETPKEEEILEFSADKDALEFAPSDEIMEFDPVGEED